MASEERKRERLPAAGGGWLTVAESQGRGGDAIAGRQNAVFSEAALRTGGVGLLLSMTDTQDRTVVFGNFDFGNATNRVLGKRPPHEPNSLLFLIWL